MPNESPKRSVGKAVGWVRVRETAAVGMIQKRKEKIATEKLAINRT